MAGLRRWVWILTMVLVASVATAAEPDPHLAAATELARVMSPPSQHAKLGDEIIAGMADQLRLQGQPLPPDFEAKMRAVMDEVVPYDELVAWSAKLWAERFTTDELQRLTVFYRTDLGRKVVDAMPAMAGETGRLLAELMPERMPAALRKHGLAP